jgi:hypothetical protein
MYVLARSFCYFHLYTDLKDTQTKALSRIVDEGATIGHAVGILSTMVGFRQYADPHVPRDEQGDEVTAVTRDSFTFGNYFCALSLGARNIEFCSTLQQLTNISECIPK